jgi:transposase
MPFVCVQAMVTSWARRAEDLTTDKTDEKDAVLIARLTAQLRCYVPEPVDEHWGGLRHLGARREQLVVEAVRQIQQIRDLLECVWRAALETAKHPFKSRTWIAALTVILQRDGGGLARTRRLGPARFEQAVRREVVRAGGKKPSLRIAAKLFSALSDPAGVIAHRPGAFERAALLLGDWDQTRRKLADAQTRMASALDDLGLTARDLYPGHLPRRLRGDPGEIGDPNRFPSARALVKHAGLAPRKRLSGNTAGRTRLTGQVRPALRLAAWRAVWAAQSNNPVFAARIGT